MKKLALIIPFLIACSCAKKEFSQPQDPGYNYYPAAAGKFSVYEIDSVVYVEIPRDTIHYRYQVKEVFADTFRGADGKKLWRLERYIRKHGQQSIDSVAWMPKDVWSVDADDRRVMVMEENVSITKLVFPVREKAAWNGNAANSRGAQNFTYVHTDQPLTLGALTFSNSLMVLQKEFRTLISYEYQAEKYARGAGLIFREVRQLYSNNIVPGKPVEGRIERGVVYTQSLIAHGYE